MPSEVKDLNVLFIDDEADNLDAFVFNCEEFWTPHTVMDPEDVMEGRYSLAGHDAVIIDLVFGYPQTLSREQKIDPGMGLQLLDWLQANHPEIPSMVLSAYLTEELRSRIEEKYPRVLCMDKPLDFSKAEFRDMMERFISEYHREG